MDRDSHHLIDATGLLTREFDRLAGGFGVMMRAWRAAVGDTIAEHAVPVAFKADGTLRVRCSSASWTSDVQLHHAPEILARLKATLGAAAPRRITAFTGRVSTTPTSTPETATPDAPQPPQLPPLDAAEVGVIREVVRGLPDDAIRGSLERAMEATARQRKSSL